MNDDRLTDEYLDGLRADARSLRRFPDDASEERMRAAVLARHASSTSLEDVLSQWMRPAMAAVLFTAIVTASIVWYGWNRPVIEPSLQSMAALTRMSEDPYLAAR